MRIYITAAVAIFCASLACVEIAASAEAAMVPVTRRDARETVAAYLRARGFSEDDIPKADNLDLASPVPAAAERTLRVASACWQAQMNRAAFRLECVEAGACLPFLVYLGISQEQFRRLESSQQTAVSSACSPGMRAHGAIPGQREIAVHAGERASLVFHGNQLRLSAQVTCLDRGGAGDVIRVRNSEGALLRARVVSAGRLEAFRQ